MSKRLFTMPPVLACVLLSGRMFAAPVACASTGAAVPLGFLGLPSISSIVEGIVNFFFQDLAKALIPDFLKKASVATIKWLVAVPDPSTWTHVGRLEGDMTMLAVSLLGVCFTAAVVRYLLVGLAGAGHPMQALSSTVASAGALIAYPWAAHQVVAMVNTLTNAVLGFQIVGEGLQRTVGIMFGGALLVGSGGVFLAVLVIVGVVFAAVMFCMKVLVLLAFALLYVTGPLAIAVRPLPELSHLVRAWGTVLIGVALIPVGWTVLFATAGALSLDATSFGGVGHNGLLGSLTSHVAGAFAALLTFYLAVKLPLDVLGQVRGALGGIGGGGPARAGGASQTGGGMQRVSDANARLRAGTLQAGRVAGVAAGALGAPAGGAVGAGMRGAGRLRAPLTGAAIGAAAPVAGRTRKVARRFSESTPGRTLAGSSRARKARDRVGAAGRVLANGPQQVRELARMAANQRGGEVPGTVVPPPHQRVRTPEPRVRNSDPDRGSAKPVPNPAEHGRERTPTDRPSRDATPSPRDTPRTGTPPAPAPASRPGAPAEDPHAKSPPAPVRKPASVDAPAKSVPSTGGQPSQPEKKNKSLSGSRERERNPSSASARPAPRDQTPRSRGGE